MRRGEVLGLRWKDVDLTKGKLTVSQSLVGNRGEHYFAPPKTAAGLRTISLDADTVRAMKEHRLANMSHELVFAEEDGSPLNPVAFSAAFQDAVRIAQLPRIRLHDLRHTFATLALRTGVNPRTVQERLGHSNVAFTLGIYTHVTERDEQDAADAVAALIFG
jgi:integrase